MKNTTRRGFTLIELLVVIAIIGILSSIILASLNGARSKGNDAKVEGQLTNARSAAELYNSTNGAYGTSTTGTTADACSLSSSTLTCPAATTYSNLFVDSASGMASLMNLNNYPAGTLVDAGVNASQTAYSIAASISSGAWCVDSTGVSRNKTSAGVPYTGNTGAAGAHTLAGATICN